MQAMAQMLEDAVLAGCVRLPQKTATRDMNLSPHQAVHCPNEREVVATLQGARCKVQGGCYLAIVSTETHSDFDL